MPLLRKAQPGSDSYGHEWKTPNSLVEVTDEQAADLLAIPDAGFTVVPRPPDEDDEPVHEVDPAGPDASAAPKPVKKTTAARRAAGA